MNTLPEKPKISFGFYKHHKGGFYEVNRLIFNATTDEWNVLYWNPHNREQQFTRSVENFLEDVRFGVKRFRLLEAYNM